MEKTLFDVYKEIAKEYNGNCKLIKTAPGLGGMNSWRVFKINIPHIKGKIDIDISQASPSRICYSFDIDLNLDLLIYREDWLDKIGKMFGLKEYEIGIKEFDDRFVIQGSNKDFVLKILDEEIRKFLLTNTSFSNLRLEKQENISVLNLSAPFNDTNFEKLRQTIEIMKRIANNICGYYKGNNR